MRSSCSTWPRTRATPPRPRRSSPRSAGYADGVADDTQHVLSPFAGTVIAVARATAEPIGDGETTVVIEAMNMEHEIVAGVADIDGRPAVVMSYDYTVLAGTQGMRNHLKKDRLFELAERRRLPVVLFAEGGGGRPGDVDWPHVAGLDCRAFNLFARLSGMVPLVGIASGYCFAGNAALLGCCDVVIATEDSSIGMGGPAMIEGGGLGEFEPQDVGPIDVQYANGVVDLRVRDDVEAVAAARRYLSYFRQALSPGPA